MKLKNGEKFNRNDLKYEKKKKKTLYDFQQFETIRSFGESIVRGKITISEAEEDRSNLLRNMVEFNKSRQEQKDVR